MVMEPDHKDSQAIYLEVANCEERDVSCSSCQLKISLHHKAILNTVKGLLNISSRMLVVLDKFHENSATVAQTCI